MTCNSKICIHMWMKSKGESCKDIKSRVRLYIGVVEGKKSKDKA